MQVFRQSPAFELMLLRPLPSRHDSFLRLLAFRFELFCSCDRLIILLPNELLLWARTQAMLLIVMSHPLQYVPILLNQFCGFLHEMLPSYIILHILPKANPAFNHCSTLVKKYNNYLSRLCTAMLPHDARVSTSSYLPTQGYFRFQS